MGLKELKPLHCMRHTGAARDAFEKWRDLISIQDRGRWRSQTSVDRYRKAHDYLAAIAAEPDLIRKRAAQLKSIAPSRHGCGDGVRKATM